MVLREAGRGREELCEGFLLSSQKCTILSCSFAWQLSVDMLFLLC